MEMKINVVMPIVSDIFNEEIKKEVKHYASDDSVGGVGSLDYGPESIESEYDEALCIPNFLEKAKEAEEAGYQGVISDCLADPGVKAAREILGIPVVGPGETAMHYASQLGGSFSIVTVLPNVVSMLENLSKVTGLNVRLASIRSVNIPVLEVQDKERLKEALYEEMVKAIEQDHAHSLVLGCTGFMGVAFELQ